MGVTRYEEKVRRGIEVAKVRLAVVGQKMGVDRTLAAARGAHDVVGIVKVIRVAGDIRWVRCESPTNNLNQLSCRPSCR